MTWKTWMAFSCALAALIVASPASWAEEATPAEPAPKPEAPAPKAAGPKEHWWGNKFALYLDAAFGQSSAADLNTSIITNTSAAVSTVSLDDQDFGRAAVGWTLPHDRGTFLVAFEGYKENSYSYDSTGFQALVLGSTAIPTQALPWWHQTVRNGTLTSFRTPPTWDVDVNDTNGNSVPDPDEVVFSGADVTITRGVPDNLINRIQTIDFLFQRDFGGRRISGRWDCGIRTLRYEGNLPASAWLSDPIAAGEGFTDGLENRILTFADKTTGIGPTFSLEVQFHFLRKRLTLYAQSRGGFLIQDLQTDSGDFYTLARDQANGAWFPAPARITEKLSKSSWNFGGEAGVRVRVATGLLVYVSYNQIAFQDSVLLPTTFSVPDNVDQVGQGTVALFNTQDLKLTTFRGGLSYQF